MLESKSARIELLLEKVISKSTKFMMLLQDIINNLLLIFFDKTPVSKVFISAIYLTAILLLLLSHLRYYSAKGHEQWWLKMFLSLFSRAVSKSGVTCLLSLSLYVCVCVLVDCWRPPRFFLLESDSTYCPQQFFVSVCFHVEFTIMAAEVPPPCIKF